MKETSDSHVLFWKQYICPNDSHKVGNRTYFHLPPLSRIVHCICQFCCTVPYEKGGSSSMGPSSAHPPLVSSAPAALFGSHHGSKTAFWIGWCLMMGLVCSLCNILYMSSSVVHDGTRLKGSASSSLSHLLNRRENNPPPPPPNFDLSIRAIQMLPPEWKLPLILDPIRQLLSEALGNNGKLQEIDPETMQRLPTVQDVTALYGATPVVLGLETCATFQHLPIMDVAEHLVSVAGSFNTGTNLLAELLIANCVMPERLRKYGTHGVRWQVLWGKHTPVDDETFRRSHRTYVNETGRNQEPPVVPEALFPGVTIRDPFKWMQSVRRLLDWILILLLKLTCSLIVVE
jgi:hypothetical protein